MNIACYISDEKMAEHIPAILARAGIGSECFASEILLLRTLRRRSFDLILVEPGSKATNEEGVFSWLNCRTGESTPVVLMSSMHNAERVALALNAGADDFISNSLDPIELVARINAVMRRCKRQDVHRTISLEGFLLDRDSRQILDRGVAVDLTSREFTMAWLMFSSVGFYLSRDTISAVVWGVDSEIANRTLEQHIYKLRKKLKLGPKRGVTIDTAYSQGYRLQLVREEIANVPWRSMAA